MLAKFNDPIMRGFARDVYSHMFAPGKPYVSTQVACLLVVDTASELGSRLEEVNPHNDFDEWDAFRSREAPSERTDKEPCHQAYHMWSAFVTVYDLFGLPVVRLIMRNMPVLCDTRVLDQLVERSQLLQTYTAGLLAYCCLPGPNVSMLVS